MFMLNVLQPGNMFFLMWHYNDFSLLFCVIYALTAVTFNVIGGQGKNSPYVVYALYTHVGYSDDLRFVS
jgi:hypothetical protein